MTRAEVVALIARREDAWNRHDIAALGRFYAPDCRVESPTAGRIVTGLQAVEDINRAWVTGFPDVVFDTTDVLADRDELAWILTATGTDTGGFMGLPSATLPQAEILALLDQRHAAWARRDVHALVAQHTADCVMDSHLAGRVQGHGAIAEVYDAWFRAFPDSVLAAERAIVDGNRVAEMVIQTGTDTGGFLGAPPTNKPFRLPIVWFLTIDGRQFSYVRPLYDFTGLLIQIGMLKAKPV
jgi:predicted ester cyclase